MRKEATLEQWKKLYEAATRIKELRPWEKFWDLDLIGIRYGEAEDTVFFSILGRGGDCYGISVYEGYKGLNSFLLLTMQESMNLSVEYAMCNQSAMTCYWGNREELTDKQRKTIKEMGYSYRGKNQWLYFLSFEPGYYPFNLDAEEVERMTEYLEDLALALSCYDNADINVDFERGNMFLLAFGKEKKTWSFGEEPLPFTAYAFGNLIITDEELLTELSKAKKCKAILEADVTALHAKVDEKKYGRPANPSISVLLDAASEMVINFQMSEPDDDPLAIMAEMLIQFVLENGAPKEIRVSNLIIEAALEHICEVCKIKLRRVKNLTAMDGFIYGLQRFRL